MSVQSTVTRKTVPDIRARRYGDLGPMIEAAIEGYAKDVCSRAVPGPEHVDGIKARS